MNRNAPVAQLDRALPSEAGPATCLIPLNAAFCSDRCVISTSQAHPGHVWQRSPLSSDHRNALRTPLGQKATLRILRELWQGKALNGQQSARTNRMDTPSLDTLLRVAAFERVRGLNEIHDHLTATELKPGFLFREERIPLVNPQRGIFKPQQMRFLLSIKTVFPKPGGKVWYDDQRDVHRQIFQGDETIDYAFMGKNPDAADNRWLKEAYENQIPIIYFLGIAPGRYQAFLPTFISGWDAQALRARVTFGPNPETLAPPTDSPERRYALRTVKQRLHQATFRAAVIAAYDGRCALSGLPEPLLLDAANIIADKDDPPGSRVC